MHQAALRGGKASQGSGVANAGGKIVLPQADWVASVAVSSCMLSLIWCSWLERRVLWSLRNIVEHQCTPGGIHLSLALFQQPAALSDVVDTHEQDRCMAIGFGTHDSPKLKQANKVASLFLPSSASAHS